MCASGFQAIVNGAQEIMTGEADIVLAVGAENMSLTPHVIRNTRWGIGLFETPMEDGLYNALTDLYVNVPMGMTAENLAEKYDLHREMIDEFAALSQDRANAGWESGRLAEECVSVEIKKRKETIQFDRDEHIRPGSTAEALAKLRPVFKDDGVITAGNASGINDGAAAVVIASKEAAEKMGRKPLGRLVAWGVSGCDPKIMGIGPVGATEKALERAGIGLADIDVIELNEAFAAQALAVIKEAGMDQQRINLDGGAIALGHPTGCSGSRILITLIHEMKRRAATETRPFYGLATLCVGVGMGVSTIVEWIGD